MNKNPKRDEEFTKSFCYIRKKGSMSLKYVCDCCGKEYQKTHNIPVEEESYNSEEPLKQKVNEATIDFQEVFLLLKNELQKQFHYCEDCHKIICSNCWNNRDEICANCPLCNIAIA